MDWTRRWRRWGGRLLTVLVLAGVATVLYPVLLWATVNSVWGFEPASACASIRGACWAVIAEKGALVLFGRYPAAELWRPALGSLALLGMAIATALPRLWVKGRIQGVILAWLVVPPCFFVLMKGGVAGLTPVAWTQWGGLPITLMLSVFGIGLAFPIGILLALGRRSQQSVVRWLAITYIEVVRGVPLIAVLFMATFILPLVLPPGWSPNLMVRAQLAIILFAAAYLAEVVRAGLQMIPKGQYEACESLGMSRFAAHVKVILPQALSLVIAPTLNTFVAILKDTSLVAIMSISELLLSSRQALADPIWRTYFVEVYVFVALIYFALCFAMGQWSKRLERSRMTFSGRS